MDTARQPIWMQIGNRCIFLSVISASNPLGFAVQNLRDHCSAAIDIDLKQRLKVFLL